MACGESGCSNTVSEALDPLSIDDKTSRDGKFSLYIRGAMQLFLAMASLPIAGCKNTPAVALIEIER